MKNSNIYISWNKVSLPEKRKEEILLDIMLKISNNNKKTKLNMKLILIPISIMLIFGFVINIFCTNNTIDNRYYIENEVNNDYVEETLYVNVIDEDIDLNNANVDMIEEGIEREKLYTYEKVKDFTLRNAFAYYYRDADNIYKNLLCIKLLYGNGENSKLSIMLLEEYLNKHKTLIGREDILKSKLCNIEVFVFSNHNTYYAIFEKNGNKYYITANETTENNFRSLLKEIIMLDFCTIIDIEKDTNREYKTVYDMMLCPKYYSLLRNK